MCSKHLKTPSGFDPGAGTSPQRHPNTDMYNCMQYNMSSGQEYLLAERTPASLTVPYRLSVFGHRRCYDLEVSVLWQSPIGLSVLRPCMTSETCQVHSLLTILLSDTHTHILHVCVYVYNITIHVCSIYKSYINVITVVTFKLK